MASYAFLNSKNVVIEVISGKEEHELLDGLTPEEWYGNFRGKKCVRTSYNSRGGKRIDPETGELIEGGAHFRFNYAGIGFTYDKTRDAFIPPKPFKSWKLDEATCLWEPPVPYPTDGEYYVWDERSKNWKQEER